MKSNLKFEYKVGYALQVLLIALSRILNLKTFLLVNPKYSRTKSQLPNFMRLLSYKSLFAPGPLGDYGPATYNGNKNFVKSYSRNQG